MPEVGGQGWPHDKVRSQQGCEGAEAVMSEEISEETMSQAQETVLRDSFEVQDITKGE